MDFNEGGKYEGEGEKNQQKEDIFEHNARLLWFEERIAASFKVKSDKMDKCIRGEDFRRCKTRFLETDRSMYILENSAGDLESFLELSCVPKRKGLEFYRRCEGSISSKMLKLRVCSIEIGPNMVPGILLVTKKHFFPSAQKPAKHAKKDGL
jgi:hypothetical protein